MLAKLAGGGGGIEIPLGDVAHRHLNRSTLVVLCQWCFSEVTFIMGRYGKCLVHTPNTGRIQTDGDDK